MTTRLYQADSYLGEFDAMVTNVLSDSTIVLDRTAFYPRGGGQPSDFGVIEHREGRLKVVEGKDHGAFVAHVIDGKSPLAGDRIKGFVDWPRRYALMRMHSSAHVLAKIVFARTGSLITGNQLDITQSRMDFNVADFNAEMAQSFIDEANAIVDKRLDVNVSVLPFEEAMRRPELFRLKNVLPKELSVLRIVAIGDFDVQADGGTHVKNTREIGSLHLVRTENKGKDNRRIYWSLG